MKKIILFYCILIPFFSYPQKQGNIWIFGKYAALDFNSGSPTPFTGSQIRGYPSLPGDFLYSEGCSSISDSSANLLFYSNGGHAWNRLHLPLFNDDSLMGFYSSTTAAFIIPKPGNDSLYYLFTTGGIERYLSAGLRYSMVDMCLDNGYGGIIATEKNVLVLDTAGEKLSAVRHPNGTNIWLISHKHFTNSFYAYEITPTGINPPVITHIGSIHTGNPGYYGGCGTAIGQMKVSPNGTKLALVFSNISPSVAELFDFDANTGILTNCIS
ncbi:hypothetical protein BH10BAC1_BH10BAC1_12340 [soil metagenome]